MILSIRCLAIAFLLLSSPLSLASARAKAPTYYSFDPAPAWVSPVVPDYKAITPAGEISDGGWPLMFDRQIDVTATGDEYYSHAAFKVINSKGVETQSRITLNVDPSFQTLSIHVLQLVRNGKVIDQAHRARITSLPNESRLEDHIYDGSYKVDIVLADVRAGDVVEYQYTLRSTDKLFSGHFASRMTTGWSDPVTWQRVRLRYPANRDIRYRFSSGDLAPEHHDDAEHRELSFTWENLAAVAGDANRPAWFTTWPILEFSDFSDWAEVARDLGTLYRLRDRPRPLLDETLATIQSAGGTLEEKTMRTLQFVQESIRYTSISIGRGSQTPSDPEIVLERRFGDCKDKSLLLATLLQRIGVAATPALVHSSKGRILPLSLPSPYVFDHVIARAQIDDAVYWLDGTNYKQHSTLARLPPADYEFALIMDASSNTLEKIPRPGADTRTRMVAVDLDLRKGLLDPAPFEVTTRYEGTAAEEMRADLAQRSSTARQADYLNYYARFYQSIKASQATTVEDDLDNDVLQVHEHYLIDKPFARSEAGELSLTLSPEELYRFGTTLDASVRKAPLNVEFPVHVLQTIVLHFPVDWSIKDDATTVDSPVFHYHSTVSYAERLLKLTYEYQALTDFVNADALTQYEADRSKLYADLDFTLRKNENVGAVATDEVAIARKKLVEAATHFQNADIAGADSMLTALIELPAFVMLSTVEQHQALVLNGLSAITQKDNKRARKLLIRSSSMKEATGLDWTYRLQAAYAEGDLKDASLALTRLARDWPSALAQVNDYAIYRLTGEAKTNSDLSDLWFPMLDALQSANWKPAGGVEPSDLWSDLALLFLEKGNLDRAAEVSSRISEPYTLIGMKADLRFAPIVKRNPSQFDIPQAAAKEVEQLQASWVKSPKSLRTLMLLVHALLSQRRFDEALALTDAALERAAASAGEQSPFDDAPTHLVWIMDARARILRGLNRWDEATEQMIRANRRADNGGIDINLGSHYCDLDRPKDALAAIADTGSLSPYGRMQLEAVRHTAALEQKDDKAAAKSMDYLRGHQADSPRTYEFELLRAGETDAAAAHLIARLRDTKLRTDALVDVQDYAETPVPPRVVQWRLQRKQLLARKDVQAAIAKAGRVDHYEFMSKAE